MAHTCHAAGCNKRVPEAMFMCKPHWFSLSKSLRDRIWHHYRPGQENDKRITKGYSEAAQHCVKVIASREGRSEDEVRRACLIYKMCEESEPILEPELK